MIAPIENTVLSKKLLLTIAEAGEAMSCCERTVSRLIAKGELHPIKVGPRGVRVSVCELEAWIAKQTEASQ